MPFWLKPHRTIDGQNVWLAACVRCHLAQVASGPFGSSRIGAVAAPGLETGREGWPGAVAAPGLATGREWPSAGQWSRWSSGALRSDQDNQKGTNRHNNAEKQNKITQNNTK